MNTHIMILTNLTIFKYSLKLSSLLAYFLHINLKIFITHTISFTYSQSGQITILSLLSI
jgi:hypothetical protein